MKEVFDNLRVRLCEELDEYSRQGINSHEDLDMVKDLLESIKNIYCIKEYMDEDKMHENGDMGQNSYRMNSSYRNYPSNMYMDNSYGRGNMSYGYDPYYDPMHSERGYYITPTYDRGYSGDSKEDMIEKLRDMMMKADKPEMKQAIQNCITTMEK